MAVSRCQYYRSGFVLLVWLQKIQELMATKYEIGLSEMKYLATSLSAKDCYDFYNLLSHHQTIQGKPPIYAEKEKAQEVSCLNLLMTWLTDPAESNFRSNENIELKLRTIGRTDLARWMLRKINSTLKRRRVDSGEINHRIEESEIMYGLDGTGDRVISIPSIEERAFTNNERVIEEQQASCLFWKVFFCTLAILLLVALFICFYRFVYTKLRCICRRLNETDDREYMLPKQTYGTASCADLGTKTTCEKKSDRLLTKNREIERDNAKENFELSDRFSSTTDMNDELISTTIAQNRALLLHNASKLTKNCATRDGESATGSRKHEMVESSLESRSSPPKSVKPFSSLTKYYADKKKFLTKRKNDFLGRNEHLNSPKSTEVTMEKRKLKPTRTDDIETTKKVKSENFLSFLSQRNKRTKTRWNSKNGDVDNSPSTKSPRWISCSCNLMQKSQPRDFSPSTDGKNKQGGMKNVEKTNTSSRCSLTELSETYDELGMLFSQHLKQQFTPCTRKYCALTRNLKKSKILSHDVTKCRNRRKSIFGERIIMSWDRRPACSSANICRDTYDEYEIMRASREERDILARSIINRRKSFLDQPCLSPVPQ